MVTPQESISTANHEAEYTDEVDTRLCPNCGHEWFTCDCSGLEDKADDDDM